jgi:cytochrome c553
MSKLIVFIMFLIGVVMTLSLSSYKKYPVSNKKFDYKEAVAKIEAHNTEMRAMVAAKEAKKIAPVVEKVAGPTVVLDTPELINGHKVYTNLGKCVVCHGKYGQGKKSQKAPKISGQHNWYLASSLTDMKSKVRVNAVMNPYLKKLTVKDLQDAAEYIAKLPW